MSDMSFILLHVVVKLPTSGIFQHGVAMGKVLPFVARSLFNAPFLYVNESIYNVHYFEVGYSKIQERDIIERLLHTCEAQSRLYLHYCIMYGEGRVEIEAIACME